MNDWDGPCDLRMLHKYFFNERFVYLLDFLLIPIIKFIICYDLSKSSNFFLLSYFLRFVINLRFVKINTSVYSHAIKQG